MQITVKSAKVLKRGTNDYGPWALVKVVTDKDVDYTTLHKEAEGIKSGMVIAIDEISIDEKDGKETRSFKKFEVVSGAATPTPSNGSEMTPELWAEKDRLERWSRECNTCFMGITQMVSTIYAKSDGEIPDYLFEVYGKALDWALAHFKTAPPVTKPAPATTRPTKEAPESKSSSVKPPTRPIAPEVIECETVGGIPETSSFQPESGTQSTEIPQTIQAFYNWVSSHGKNYTRTWVLSNIGMVEEEIRQDIEKAYYTLKELQQDW